jgi:leader peptidase (prepilin peptidase)/N-methyltransferase
MLSLQLVDLFILISLSILLGGLFGSFATAMIYRLPRNIPIAFGDKSKQGGKGDGAARSYCLRCNHQLGFLDLIPMVSYLFLKGRCRHCGAAYGRSYFLVECMSILLTFAALFYYGLSASTLLYVASIPVLLSLIAIDLEHYILPNILVAALWCLGAAAQFIFSYTQDVMVVAQSIALHSAIYAAVALLIGFVFSKILKKDALGLGDVKFFAAAGVWLGISVLPAFMMLAGGLGVLHGGYMRLKHKDAIFPFGPSLIISLGLCYIFKDTIMLYFYG